jgi:hypothetical protein
MIRLTWYPANSMDKDSIFPGSSSWTTPRIVSPEHATSLPFEGMSRRRPSFEERPVKVARIFLDLNSIIVMFVVEVSGQVEGRDYRCAGWTTSLYSHSPSRRP